MGERKQDTYISCNNKTKNFYRSSKLTGDIYDLLPEDHKDWFKKVEKNNFEEIVSRTVSSLSSSNAILHRLVARNSYHTRFSLVDILNVLPELNINFHDNLDMRPDGTYCSIGLTRYGIVLNNRIFNVQDLDRQLENYFNRGNTISQSTATVEFIRDVEFEEEDDEEDEFEDDEDDIVEDNRF